MDIEIDIEMQVELLKESEYLQDKLSIYALLNYAITGILECTYTLHPGKISLYSKYILSGFMNAARFVNERSKITSYEEFTNIFVRELQTYFKENLLVRGALNDISNNYKKILDIEPYIRVIENKDLAFEDKVALYSVMYEHNLNVSLGFDGLYDSENIKKVENDIINELSEEVLDAFIDKYFDYNVFYKNIKRETKNIIYKKMNAGEFDVLDFNNAYMYIYKRLNSREKKIMLLETINELSGYTKDESYYERVLDDDLLFFGITPEEYEDFTLLLDDLAYEYELGKDSFLLTPDGPKILS